MLKNLEVSKKYLSLYQNPPLCANYWGSVVKEQLRKINPARVRYTEFKPPQGGFIYNEQTMDKKKVIVYVDGYNFYYGLKNGGAKWLLIKSRPTDCALWLLLHGAHICPHFCL